MVDSENSGAPAGGQAPGPEGSGFAYHPLPPELIVIANPGRGRDLTRGRAVAELLGSRQATLEPLFGGAPGTDDTLALFHRVRGAGDDADALAELAARIAELPGVGAAYAKPGALPAALGPRSTGPDEAADADRRKKEGAALPDFSGRQAYLAPAPEGLDTPWAWQQAGGSGEGVSVVDVEAAWQLGHRDLGHRFAGIVVGTPFEDLAWRNHGTNVLGVLAAGRDGTGTVGIVPEAATAGASVHGTGTAPALVSAAERLAPGDILLLPLHRPGPAAGYRPSDHQGGHIPLEWWPDDHAAIRWATSRGVVVVAAAGNGAENLDSARYETRPEGFPSWWHSPFGPSGPDSGAILVGAGAPPPGTHGHDHGPDRSRLAFSNHGSRVDVQGWGHEVTTTGGFWNRPGDLHGGTDEESWYTDAFSGTSPAAATVAGAIAALQGMLRTAGLVPLPPGRVRDVLRATGSPQQEAPDRPVSQRIGSRPALRAMVDHLVPRQVFEGVAERLWDDLVPHPRDHSPCLRLYVDGAWRTLDHPEPHVRQAVHAAFAGGRPSVRVRYAGEEVLGLVVTGESP